MPHSDPSLTDSSQSLPPQLQRSKRLATAGVVLAGVGLADASYLASKFFAGTPVPCGIGQGCDVVTRSSYAEIAGVPIALIGACWYLVLLMGWFVVRESGNRRWTTAVALSTTLGAAASGYFVYLMFFVLKAVCTYCMLSAIIHFTMLGIGIATLYAVHHSSRSASHE